MTDAPTLTQQEAQTPDLVALTVAGLVHALAEHVLLNHVLMAVTLAADRLVALGAKPSAT
ncbi:MAG: hypothetical protein QOF58_286 [Pseudonocardiales bacterium]|nr:hypothetical protein [Pseudonocardiales bacterium]